MERLDANIRTADSTLEQAPKVFNAHRTRNRGKRYLPWTLSRTNFVTGPARPPRIGVAKALTTAPTAPGTSSTMPSTSLAITLSLALFPFAASFFNASTFCAASCCISCGAAPTVSVSGRKTWSSCALEISVPTILSRPTMSPPTVKLPPLMFTPPLCPLAFFSSLISGSFLIAVPIYAPSQSKTWRSSPLSPGPFRRVPAAFCSSPPLSQLCAHHCGIGAFDLLVNPQGSFGERYGLGALAELVTGQAHVPKRARFAVPVPDCARDLEGQVVVLNGAAGLAQSVVGIAQVAQHGPF